MKKFFVSLTIAVTFIFLFGVNEKFVNAAERQPAIYDYNAENLISRLVEEAKRLNGKFFGKSYFTHTDGYKYCVMYFGNDKNIYVGFQLNYDYTVIRTYVVAEDKQADNLVNSRLGVLTGLLMISLGLNSNDATELLSQATDYINYASKNHYDFSKISKTFYKYCSSINKNVYLEMESANDGKGFSLELGVTD